jgi:hypothetical protein
MLEHVARLEILPVEPGSFTVAPFADGLIGRKRGFHRIVICSNGDIAKAAIGNVLGTLSYGVLSCTILVSRMSADFRHAALSEAGPHRAF